MSVLHSRFAQVFVIVVAATAYLVWDKTERGVPLTVGLIFVAFVGALLWVAVESAICGVLGIGTKDNESAA